MYAKLKELIFKILALKNAKHFEAEYSGIVNLGVFLQILILTKVCCSYPWVPSEGAKAARWYLLAEPGWLGPKAFLADLKQAKLLWIE